MINFPQRWERLTVDTVDTVDTDDDHDVNDETHHNDDEFVSTKITINLKFVRLTEDYFEKFRNSSFYARIVDHESSTGAIEINGIPIIAYAFHERNPTDIRVTEIIYLLDADKQIYDFTLDYGTAEYVPSIGMMIDNCRIDFDDLSSQCYSELEYNFILFLAYNMDESIFGFIYDMCDDNSNESSDDNDNADNDNADNDNADNDNADNDNADNGDESSDDSYDNNKSLDCCDRHSDPCKTHNTST